MTDVAAELLAGLRSGLLVETVAVGLSVDPLAAVTRAFTVKLNCVLEATLPKFMLTVPPLTAGAQLGAQEAGVKAEAKLVPGGSTMEIVALKPGAIEV